MTKEQLDQLAEVVASAIDVATLPLHMRICRLEEIIEDLKAARKDDRDKKDAPQ